MHTGLVAFVLALLFLFPAAAPLQDPVKVDGRHYTVEFENAQVRVLRIKYAAGEKSVMHNHPDGVAVFLTDYENRFTLPGGAAENSTGKAGSTSWAPAGAHLPENIGKRAMELILVELKK
jgi:quercetin dioxygenase-like cupin family protein